MSANKKRKISIISISKSELKQQKQITRLKDRDFVLKRPDRDVGSVLSKTVSAWIYDEQTQKFVWKNKLKVVDALYNIYNEIIVNAADQYQDDPLMTYIKVQINSETGWISVENDGTPISTADHFEYKIPTVQLLFGQLRVSTSYTAKKGCTKASRNGIGSKATNILSKEFIVEVVDVNKGIRYVQKWSDNMGQCHEPIITFLKKGEEERSYIRISFLPDLARFTIQVDNTQKTEPMKFLKDSDTHLLMIRRVYDLAGTTLTTLKRDKPLNVYLNGCKIDSFNGFEAYCKCFQESILNEERNKLKKKLLDSTKNKSQQESNSSEFTTVMNPVVMGSDADGRYWKIAIMKSHVRGRQQELQHMSFVNSIWTSKGGTHVEYIGEQIAEATVKKIKEKNPKSKVSAEHVRSCFRMVVSCLVADPSFESQTKRILESQSVDFVHKCILKKEWLNECIKQLDLENLAAFETEVRDISALKNANAQKTTRVSKLEDANHAGRKGCYNSLIITEGDSAAASAVAGLSVIGRDNNGVWGVKGKWPNIASGSISKAIKKKVIRDFASAMGLKFEKKYDEEKDYDDLRYQEIKLMCDSDKDGLHIMGTILADIAKIWPNLVINKFKRFKIIMFITPQHIYKKLQGHSDEKGAYEMFFTTQEQIEWLKQKGPNKVSKNYAHKYCKGLGSINNVEMRMIFQRLDECLIELVCEDPSDLQALDLVFGKDTIGDMANKRKEWLKHFDQHIRSDRKKKRLSISEFVHKDLIHYSDASNKRGIIAIDGNKDVYRKLYWYLIMNPKVGYRKLESLAANASETTGYEHGAKSMEDTIVKQTHDFRGTNNLVFISPESSFGTRLKGGKDATQARYGLTQMIMPLFRTVFRPEDDSILKSLRKQVPGQVLGEPPTLLPTICMPLVNGCEGIGTGWYSSIPCCDPRVLVKNHRILLQASLEEKDLQQVQLLKLSPWYRGFKGEICFFDYSYKSFGRLEKVSKNQLRITELPIGVWTSKYRVTILDKMRDLGWIDYKSYETDTDVWYDIDLLPGMPDVDDLKPEEWYAKFSLSKVIETNNMVMFDSQGEIRRFNTLESIFHEFHKFRIPYYAKRKELQLNEMDEVIDVLRNKVRYLNMVRSGEFPLFKAKNDKEILQHFIKHNFKRVISETKMNNEDVSSSEDSLKEIEELDPTLQVELNQKRLREEPKLVDYNYLRCMQSHVFVKENTASQEKRLEKLEQDRKSLELLKPEQIWLKDLDDLELAIEEYEKSYHLRQCSPNVKSPLPSTYLQPLTWIQNVILPKTNNKILKESQKLINKKRKQETTENSKRKRPKKTDVTQK